MEFETKHIGSYGGNPAKILELTIIANGIRYTEDLLDFKTNKVDQTFINDLRMLGDELQEHNDRVDNNQ